MYFWLQVILARFRDPKSRSYAFSFVYVYWNSADARTHFFEFIPEDICKRQIYWEDMINKRKGGTNRTMQLEIWYFPPHLTTTQLNIYIINFPKTTLGQSVLYPGGRGNGQIEKKIPGNKVFGGKSAAKLKFADCISWLFVSLRIAMP